MHYTICAQIDIAVVLVPEGCRSLREQVITSYEAGFQAYDDQNTCFETMGLQTRVISDIHIIRGSS